MDESWDESVMKRIWNGSITIGVTIDKSDISNSTNVPPVYYNTFRRVSYFFLELEEAVKYYLPYTNIKYDGSSILSIDFWVSFNDEPLKWSLPIGVLYDMLATDKTSTIWHINLHFSNFPIKEIIRFYTVEEIENFIMASVKESDYLTRDMASMKLAKVLDQKKLLTHLSNGNFEKYFKIKKPFLQIPLKYIPFRLYKNGTSYYQSLIKFNETNSKDTHHNTELTFGEFISKLQHGIIVNQTDDGLLFHNPRLTIQGIDIPKGVTMLWLYQHLSYPDCFLHIVVCD